ncbi:universal stress protein A [Aureimonas sp. SA4125]|uniref:universal stress protein n=1 Tax=Aureimonas sp. SA4125 TaxID=2826993 RepID=UPI001CC70CA6|nr:universal stress protein [Aureimonas sp. SA4125]BDA83322.1 universal stress protein A [Aureimonas sp. SA4125]
MNGLGTSAISTAAFADKSAASTDDMARTAVTVDAVRDILVHLDGSTQDLANLAHAEMIATVFSAHVRGVITHAIPAALVTLEPELERLSAAFWQNDAALFDKAEAQARQRLLLLGAGTDLLRIDGMSHELGRAVAQFARAVDLVIMGRPYGGSSRWPDLLESVLFDAGAPAFVVPPEASHPKDPDRILIGWRDTTECSHAIAAALPFLKNAERVFLVEVRETNSADPRASPPAADMARHLARHGIAIEVRSVANGTSPADGLLNEAALVGAELIVIGAYGRSRLREFLLGGVTRDLLTKSVVPLLMAH